MVTINDHRPGWWAALNSRDYRQCPYFKGTGTCGFGCREEPVCMTDPPPDYHGRKVTTRRHPEPVTLESCICGGCYHCPDGWHYGNEAMPCSCTADCALEACS